MTAQMSSSPLRRYGFGRITLSELIKDRMAERKVLDIAALIALAGGSSMKVHRLNQLVSGESTINFDSRAECNQLAHLLDYPAEEFWAAHVEHWELKSRRSNSLRALPAEPIPMRSSVGANFHAHLQTALEVRGENVSWLAKQANVNENLVKKWLAGTVSPSSQQLEKLVVLLGEVLLFPNTSKPEIVDPPSGAPQSPPTQLHAVRTDAVSSLIDSMQPAGKIYTEAQRLADTTLVQPIGQRIAAMRTFLGWNQSELARRSWLSDNTISRIESGVTQSLKVSTLDKLSRAMCVDFRVSGDHEDRPTVEIGVHDPTPQVVHRPTRTQQKAVTPLLPAEVMPVSLSVVGPVEPQPTVMHLEPIDVVLRALASRLWAGDFSQEPYEIQSQQAGIRTTIRLSGTPQAEKTESHDQLRAAQGAFPLLPLLHEQLTSIRIQVDDVVLDIVVERTSS